MFYGLKINDSWTICNTSERFAESFGPVSDQNAFHQCLEDYLQEGDGECQLPWYADESWTFWKGNSEEELREDKGELIITLHAGNKDALWELEQWVSGPSTCFRIRVDY